MPTADPLDQQAARNIESLLRDAVARRERPEVELEWYLSLPKRIRRSGKLLEAAQVEARVLLEHARLAWAKAGDAERERTERLAQAKARPRDLECLRAPDPAAWNGLGRRKKRCRKFEAVGRAYNTRQHALNSLSETPAPAADVQCAHSSISLAPTRPPTPPGLRSFVRNVPGLLHWASGPADATQYGLPTPPSPSPLPSPPSPVPPIVV